MIADEIRVHQTFDPTGERGGYRFETAKDAPEQTLNEALAAAGDTLEEEAIQRANEKVKRLANTYRLHAARLNASSPS